jgi:cation diffusion facilitator CzcD-associated flavoprotein CzcO
MSRVLVVGAGPAGLACALSLVCHGVDDVEVVDPSGRWLAGWDRRFAAQDIPHLRSPAVHHPHPDPFALLGATPHDQLVRSGRTSLPSTRAFRRFVTRTIADAGLADAVTPTTATALTLDASGRATVQLGDGTRRRPDRVVLATNARRPAVPAALAGLLDHPGVSCGDAADVAATPVGGHVTVVGGGLSAAHLAIGAVRRGARVTLVARRRLRVKRFDTHPSWLGPKQRRPFEAEPDPALRRRAIDRARGGGSIPHRFHAELLRCRDAGLLTLHERAEVVGAEAVGTPGGTERIEIALGEGARWCSDRVWLATGGAIDVADDHLCRPLLASAPVAVADGLPDLAADLTWPGTTVHLVGAAASLVLGPTAGNLIGHRRAAFRVRASLLGQDPAREDRTATGPNACPTLAEVAR